MTSRRLYSDEYLQSDCSLEYDDRYNHDDLFWTWATNLVIVVVCLPGLVQAIKGTRSFYYSTFWLFTIITNILACLIHSTVHERNGRDFDVFQMLIFIAQIISMTKLLKATLAATLLNIEMTSKQDAIINILIAVVVVIIICAIAVTSSVVVVGIYSLVTYTIALILFFVKCKTLHTVAFFVLTASLPMQLILASTCGDDGYEDCFRDCPLPNPHRFNHNALFHIVWAIGLLFLVAAEHVQPMFLKKHAVVADTINGEDDEHAIKSAQIQP